MCGCYCHARPSALASGLDHVTVVHRSRFLSDNGSSYVTGDLAKRMEHVRGTVSAERNVSAIVGAVVISRNENTDQD
jgi:hypothetical protein